MKPNCYDCEYRRSVPGDAHSSCVAVGAEVTGKETGIRRGWFWWPWNFDPVWLEECNGFKEKDKT